jgi:anti-sigma B factor antagonist
VDGFALHLVRGHDRDVVAVVGELDGATVPELHEMVTTLVTGGSRDIVLDLRRMTFVDSSGLGGMLGARQLLVELGGSLVLRAPTAKTRKVLVMGGLEGVFGVES